MSFKINTKVEFEKFVSEHWNDINSYIDSKFEKEITPIYSSVDIRESKDKLAPVDHNMYPAGFNNLCSLDLDYATEVFASAISSIKDKVTRIGIVPDIEVHPTIEGIRQGKDELLEKAIEIIVEE